MEKFRARWNAWEGLGAGTIKIIAVISMLIDHTAAGILGRYLDQADAVHNLLSGDQVLREAWMARYGTLYYAYRIMRGIGRLAFPIYCYFLVEGLKYTRNVWKYVLRLLLFAILSEIPFDLLFNGSVFELGYQNVYFTLMIGLMTIVGMREVRRRISKRWLYALLGYGILAAGCLLAAFLRTDYSYKGVLCIVVIYLFSYSRISQLIAGAAVFCWELPMAPLAFPLLALYKKKRGFGLKYFFYAVYPVHLLLLYSVTEYLGIWEFSAL